MNQDTNQHGFTLVELMLAMAFVSFLLIAVALTVIQIGNTYTRGLTLKQVNQSGVSISSDMVRSISAVRPFDVSAGNGHYVVQSSTPGGVVKGGRLCTGSYTYIWNLGTESTENRYVSGVSVSAPIRLVKVVDSGSVYCTTPLPNVDPTTAVELLPEGERLIAVQDFAITRVAGSVSIQQALYKIQLLLGTDGINRDISTVDASCKPPGDSDSKQEYCAINKFEFTVRAGNRGV